MVIIEPEKIASVTSLKGQLLLIIDYFWALRG